MARTKKEKEEENAKLDALEKDIENLQDSMEHLLTHKNRLRFLSEVLAERLAALVSGATGRYLDDYAIVNLNDLENLADAWTENVESINICVEDISQCYDYEGALAKFLLEKAEPLLDKKDDNK